MPYSKRHGQKSKTHVAMQPRPRVAVKLDRQLLGDAGPRERSKFIDLVYSVLDRSSVEATIVVGFALPGANMTPPGFYLSSDISGRLPKKLQPGDPSGLYEQIQSVVDEALAQFTEQQTAEGIRGATVKRTAITPYNYDDFEDEPRRPVNREREQLERSREEISSRTRTTLRNSELVMFLKTCVEILETAEETGRPPIDDDFSVLVDTHTVFGQVVEKLAELGDRDEDLEDRIHELR